MEKKEKGMKGAIKEQRKTGSTLERNKEDCICPYLPNGTLADIKG
jgi:hypothetical protein